MDEVNHSGLAVLNIALICFRIELRGSSSLKPFTFQAAPQPSEEKSKEVFDDDWDAEEEKPIDKSPGTEEVYFVIFFCSYF